MDERRFHREEHVDMPPYMEAYKRSMEYPKPKKKGRGRGEPPQTPPKNNLK